jgi:hypothetical protein
LGQLISIAKDKQYIDKNTIKSLEVVIRQRNFFIHNVYSLLVGDSTPENENMWEKDVELFIERAWQLQENLNQLTDIF